MIVIRAISDIAFDVNVGSERSSAKAPEFTTKSKTAFAGDSLTKLDGQPSIKVGNVAPGEGNVVVAQDELFRGNTYNDFKITFTAAGPMYTDPETTGILDEEAYILIQFPFEIPDAVLSNIRISRGTRDTTNVPSDQADDSILIKVDNLRDGQEVVLRGELTVPASANAVSKIVDSSIIPQTTPETMVDPFNSSFRVFTSTGATIDFAAETAELERNTINTVPEPDVKFAGDEIEVSGGKIRAKEGSGTLTVTIGGKEVVEKGSEDVTVKIVYEAKTYVPDIIPITITLPSSLGGVEKDNISDNVDEVIEYSSNVISWQSNFEIEAGRKLEVTITKVDIPNSTADLSFTSTVGSGDAEVGPTDEITVVGTGEDVDFEMVDENGNPIPDPSYPAASKQMIRFRFTARNTPIGEGGHVKVQLPPAWSGATTGNSPRHVELDTDLTLMTVIDEQLRQNSPVSASSSTITIYTYNKAKKKGLAKGDSVTIRFGTMPDADKDYRVPMSDRAGDIEVKSVFKAGTGFTEYPVRTIEVEIGNVADGSGTATIRSSTAIKAGKANSRIDVKFTAQGSMGGGKVSLEIPDGWGEMQRESSAMLNYIDVTPANRVEAVNYDDIDDGDGDSIVVATLKDDFDKGDTITFIYGGGTDSANNGALAQDSVGVASFTIMSDGDGDDSSASLLSETEPPAAPAKPVGRIYKGADGALKVEVESAADGSGTVKIEIAGSKTGDALYDGETVDTAKKIHAADDQARLEFTYTADRVIKEGKLRLNIPTADGWSEPQNDTTGEHGFTRVTSTGQIGDPVMGTNTVTVPITQLDRDDTITINYGAAGDGAQAPRNAGPSRFTMAIQGRSDEDGGSLTPLDDLLVVDVRAQASGGGTGLIDVTDTLRAGDMDQEVRVVYTATGQIREGRVKLTIPADWSAPMAESFAVNPASAYESATYGGDETPATQEVIVIGVNLAVGGSLTFVYSDVMVQPTRADDIQFKVAVDGGEGPGSADETSVFADIADLTGLTVDIREARAGSGMASVDPTAVDADGEEVTLTFTYTATGDIFPPASFSVTVPSVGWDLPTSSSRASAGGRYEVKHMRGTDDIGQVVELNPDGRKMKARVTSGGRVQKADTIMFIYHSDPPTSAAISTFKVYYDGEMVGDDVGVLVQPAGGATQIALMDVATLSVDAVEQMPVAVIVQLQAADGDTATAETDLMITLTSDSSTGMFVADPEAEDAEYSDEVMITIAAGMWDGMAYYMDETLGDYMITATADDATFDTVMTPVAVKTDVVEITIDAVTITDSEGVEKDFAMVDDTVTITATGTSDKTVTAETVGGHANPSLTEDPAGSGSYSGSFTVVSLHPDDTYDVTVDIDDGGDTDTEADAFTIDTTGPAVTVSDIEGTVADGGTVTISATVSDGDGSGVSSVMADVSDLDSTQTEMIELAMGADGSYSRAIEISTNNTELNGEKTITVTAMDNAGNGGESSTTVTLENALSFTSMIPSGISLFHVPLDDPSFNTIGDLRTAIGDAKVSSLIAYDAAGELEPDSDNMPIAGGSGIIVILHNGSEATVTFAGEPWSGDNAKITLEAGDTNLIGLPLDIEGVDKISDIIGLDAAIEGVYPNLTDFVAAPNDAADGDVKGDAAYYVLASAAATITVSGDGWSDSAGMMAGAAPIALSGYKVDSQTPVLSVFGSVVDEITGVAKEGFRVKVKNLSTKAAVSEITSIETADGYSMTLLDLANANAARVGDVLEISADSPNPLIGVKPVRHTVTVDDVKNSTIQLEELIAYEIPAETELLRNYPNPFNPETWIPYRLAEDADVSLTIYDTSGALVRSIDIGHQTAAVYETRAKAIYWDGRNRFGEQVASGLYFYHLSAGDFSGTRRMVILK